MQPVALTPNETTTQCCAGIRVFLEKLNDPTLVFTAQVSTDGTPFTDRNVTREGDVVYVEGLQAGTPYNIMLTAWNQFGRVMSNVSTTPLIGEAMRCVILGAFGNPIVFQVFGNRGYASPTHFAEGHSAVNGTLDCNM